MITHLQFKSFVDSQSLIDMSGLSRTEKADKVKLLLPQENEDSIEYWQLLKIGEALVFEHELLKVDNQFYSQIVRTIDTHLGNGVKRIIGFDNSRWVEVLSACKELEVTDDSFVYENDKVHSRAKAAARLVKQRIGVSIQNNDLTLDNMEEAFSKVKTGVRKIGGVQFLQRLLALEYHNELGRFLILDRGNQPNPLNAKINLTPYNYLFNIALANLDARPANGINAEETYKKTIKLATDLCFVICPVQAFGQVWEDIFHKGKTPLQYLSSLVYKESIYNLTQRSAWFTLDFCDFLANNIDALGIKWTCSYSLNDYLRVLKCVLTKHTVHNQILPVNEDVIRHETEVNGAETILEDASWVVGELDKDFLLPIDTEKINHHVKPLVKKSGKYYALPASTNSWGWYEVMLSKYRNDKIDIDKIVGELFEEYVTKKFEAHGIVSVEGVYLLKDGQTKGEADKLVETEKNILLFELKKKSLSQKAKSGFDFAVLMDIAGSLIESQHQCYRTSATIRNDGQIELIDKEGEKHTVLWNNRSFEHITLSLQNFGPVQDRILVKPVLEEMMRYEFGMEEVDETNLTKDEKKQLKSLKKSFKKFTDAKDALYQDALVSNECSNPFFNSWFLDAEQLMVLLSNCNSSDDLCETLNSFKYVSMGTYDFYAEWFYRMMFKNGSEKTIE